MSFSYVPVENGILVSAPERGGSQEGNIFRTKPEEASGTWGQYVVTKSDDTVSPFPFQMFTPGDRFVPCNEGDRLWVVESVTGSPDGLGPSFTHLASFVVGDETWREESNWEKGVFFVYPKMMAS